MVTAKPSSLPLPPSSVLLFPKFPQHLVYTTMFIILMSANILKNIHYLCIYLASPLAYRQDGYRYGFLNLCHLLLQQVTWPH